MLSIMLNFSPKIRLGMLIYKCHAYKKKNMYKVQHLVQTKRNKFVHLFFY